MRGEVMRRVERGLDAAERAGACYVPEGAAERRALAHRGVELVEPIEGMYVRRRRWRRLSPPERLLFVMRGVAARHPSWTFCGTSAAVAHGLPVSWSQLARVQVVSRFRAASRALPGMEHHGVSDGASELVLGLRVTPLWRTVFDCLVALPPADALAVADAALRMTNVSPRGLVEHLRTTYRGHRGVRAAARVAVLADGRAESGGESIARYVMVEQGFELPELQVWIEDPVEPGTWFRVDFLWFGEDGSLIIGELDGRQKSERAELMGGRSAVRVLQDERLRESHLTALRPAIVRFSFDDVADGSRLSALLDSFGVPRRRGDVPDAPSATVTRRAELVTLSGWTVLVTECVAA